MHSSFFFFFSKPKNHLGLFYFDTHRGLGQSAPSMATFSKARVAAAKIFRIIDHKPGIDRNSESGMDLETVNYWTCGAETCGLFLPI